LGRTSQPKPFDRDSRRNTIRNQLNSETLKTTEKEYFESRARCTLWNDIDITILPTD
jgi:hypothetical protein